MAMLPHPIWFMSLAAIALPSVTFGCWWALKRKKTVNLGGNHE
jgi:hypothetical protein